MMGYMDYEYEGTQRLGYMNFDYEGTQRVLEEHHSDHEDEDWRTTMVSKWMQ